MLTQEYLKSLLDYDPDTGVFRWRIDRGGRAVKGARAGGIAVTTGYWRIGIDRKTYLAHRLAWLYVYGAFPERETDHINGDILDNRIANLRPVTARQNQNNLPVHRAGRLAGTNYTPSWSKAKPWRARIRIDGKHVSLGSFATEHEAHMAYSRKFAELHECAKRGGERASAVTHC